MAIQCPRIVWPDHLAEEGPPEDRSIYLRGRARVGEAWADVRAIRIDPALRMMPDYKKSVPSSCYADLQLDTLLDELACLADSDPLATVELDGGHYVIWLIPCGAQG